MPKVAFLIIYISYNCVHTKKDTIEENEIYQFMINELTEYIINNSCSKKFQVVEDIKKFWKKYGEHLVWEAHYVKNNEWINIKPTDEDILSNIQNLSNSFIDDDYETIISNENDSTIFTISDDESDSTIFTISDNQNEIQYVSSVSSSISDVSSYEELIEINWSSISNQEMENLTNIEDF